MHVCIYVCVRDVCKPIVSGQLFKFKHEQIYTSPSTYFFSFNFCCESSIMLQHFLDHQKNKKKIIFLRYLKCKAFSTNKPTGA